MRASHRGRICTSEWETAHPGAELSLDLFGVQAKYHFRIPTANLRALCQNTMDWFVIAPNFRGPIRVVTDLAETDDIICSLGVRPWASDCDRALDGFDMSNDHPGSPLNFATERSVSMASHSCQISLKIVDPDSHHLSQARAIFENRTLPECDQFTYLNV